MINALNKASRKIFLKDLIKKCDAIKKYLNAQYTDDNHTYKGFINDLKNKLRISLLSLKAINLEKPSTIDIAFLSFFNFLETFTTYYIKYDTKEFVYKIGSEKEEFIKYSYNDKGFQNYGKFIPNGKYDKPSWSKSLSAIFIDYFKISASPYDEIKDIEDIQNQRNNYIHSSKNKFSKEELTTIIDLCRKSCSNLKD